MKTWQEKLNSKQEPKVKRLEKRFADIQEGQLIYISTPEEINEYVSQLEEGTFVTQKEIRQDLALRGKADGTCPVTVGIYLRIVAEAAYEQFQEGTKLADITPFWRAVDPESPLAKKLTCGVDFLIKQRRKES